MKRIVFVHQASTVGGGSYCLLNLVRSIDRFLFEPVVLLKEEGMLADEFRRLGIRVILFPGLTEIPYNESLFRFRSLRAYYDVNRSLDAFERILREEKADAVYLNNMMISPYLVAAKRAGCKTVLHVREHWPLDEHRRQLDRLRKIVGNHCDRLVAINNYSASIFPDMESTVIHDWIDMDSRNSPVSTRDLFGEDMSGKKMFLFMGGVQRIKGAYQVLKTFCTRLTDESYRLLVLGCTKELSGRGVVKLAKTLLYRLGIPTYEYKVKMLARNDPRVVCIPGTYNVKSIMEQTWCMLSYYTIPHANLSMAEAIILGIPVIAADGEEAQEYSLGGKLAVLYSMNDQDAFEKAVSGFISQEGRLRASLDSESRKAVQEMFSPAANIAALNSLLTGLLS